jgi:hypothetical protein
VLLKLNFASLLGSSRPQGNVSGFSCCNIICVYDVICFLFFLSDEKALSFDTKSLCVCDRLHCFCEFVVKIQLLIAILI